MNKVSRRAISRYAADQLQNGASASQLAKQLSSVIIEAGLADQVDFLIDDIAWELERRGELTAATVTSAHPLSDKLEAEIKAALKKAVKVHEVLLEENVDKAVIGGVRIETPGRVWDSTISRKLKDLREAF